MPLLRRIIRPLDAYLVPYEYFVFVPVKKNQIPVVSLEGCLVTHFHSLLYIHTYIYFFRSPKYLIFPILDIQKVTKQYHSVVRQPRL